ncbi:MAG: ribosome recycling factor [bacterium]
MEKIIKEAKERMEKVVSSCKDELSHIRTGRASASLVEHIKVECYGSLLPLNQVASISIPEARQIVIQPWDKTQELAITKAIMNSKLGLHPTSDGEVIRLNVPALTGERKKELDKTIRALAEEKRVVIRNIRHELNHKIDAMKKNKEIGEDSVFTLKDEIQKETDEYIVKIDALLLQKEKEIIEG